MINYLEQLKKKISDKFKPEKILLIDNSKLHRTHKSFSSEKLHLKLIIQSKNLKNMTKIESHRKIFSLLDEDMKNKIHALEIIIE